MNNYFLDEYAKNEKNAFTFRSSLNNIIENKETKFNFDERENEENIKNELCKERENLEDKKAILKEKLDIIENSNGV